MRRLILAAAAALSAPTALANAPPPPMHAPAWAADQIGEDWTLFVGDISIACPEAKKQLRITLGNPWIDNSAVDKVTVTFGDKSFEATQDTSVNALVYVMQADADSITSLMLATNAVITLKSDTTQWHKGALDDTEGTFNLFATTCAQINGL